MAKTAFDASRSNVFLLAPEDIVLITDEQHPLYDERVKLPINEGMVVSIMEHGVTTPITVVKDGEKAVVISGLQRVKNACEANKRLKKDGKEPVLIKSDVRRGEDVDLLGVAMLGNVHQDDPPMVTASKLQRYINMGRTEAQAAVVIGQKMSYVKALLTLLDLAKPVQAAVTAGGLSVSAAASLSGLDREKQIEAMHTAGAGKKPGKKTSVKAAKKAVKKSKGEKDTDAPGKKEIKALLFSKLLDSDDTVHALAWVLVGERKGKIAAALKKLEAAEEAA